MARQRARYINVGNMPYKTPPEGVYKPEHWQEEAACARAPERDKQILTGYPSVEDARDVNRRYCKGCPVKSQCFNWGYSDRNFVGVAGGAVFSGLKSAGHQRQVQRIQG